VGDGNFDFRSLCTQIDDRGLEPVVVLEHHTAEETTRSLMNYQQIILDI
jgi:hypothetical protein